ncbi:hypothetical protein SALBM217S_06598 [Streptomyces griseoloalbus]
MDTDGFTTCLWFDGQAEEAAQFYVSVFDNSKLGEVVRNTGAVPGEQGTVLTVEFTANGQRVRRPERRAGVHVQRGDLLPARVRRPGGDRPLRKAGRGRRRARPLRLAQGPLRRLLAGQRQTADPDDRRPGPREGRPRAEVHDDDGQAGTSRNWKGRTRARRDPAGTGRGPPSRRAVASGSPVRARRSREAWVTRAPRVTVPARSGARSRDSRGHACRLGRHGWARRHWWAPSGVRSAPRGGGARRAGRLRRG